ncbi:hypothetical protein [Salana multivorans]
MATDPTAASTATTAVAVPSRRTQDVAAKTARVILYSDDVTTRATVRRAVGRRASKDTPFVEWLEVATAEALFSAIADGGYDLAIVDGETAKVGGFGMARQIKDSYFDAPAILLLIARQQDAWLAAWSQADGVVASPYAPEDVSEAVASLLRRAAAS